MKKVFVFLFLSFGTLSLATAQETDSGKSHSHREASTPEERAEASTKRMSEKLSLNENQASQVKTIYLEQYTQMKDLRAKRQDDSSGKASMREDIKALAAETDTKLKSVLTTEQFSQYQQAKKARSHRKHPAHRQPSRG